MESQSWDGCAIARGHLRLIWQGQNEGVEQKQLEQFGRTDKRNALLQTACVVSLLDRIRLIMLTSVAHGVPAPCGLRHRPDQAQDQAIPASGKLGKLHYW